MHKYWGEVNSEGLLRLSGGRLLTFFEAEALVYRRKLRKI
jgi:hypothetical protein